MIRLLTKITFQNPRKANILIFDAEGSEILIRMVLEGMDYSILHSRFEKLFFSPIILLKTLQKIKISDIIKDRNFKGVLYKNYLLSCIEFIEPKIVLTFMDNDPTFHWISRKYKRSQFYAIQNGNRTKLNLCDVNLDRNGNINIISMPNLLCFGQHDVDIYRKYGHQVDHFHIVGSLIGGYYRYQKSKMDEPKKFNICLVSQYRDDHYDESIKVPDNYPKFVAQYISGYKCLLEFLRLYLAKNNLSFCIAMATKSLKEYEFYRNFFGEGINIINQNDSDNLSTYDAMNSSDLIIALDSTAAVEAFGWGEKVLFCNFTGDESRNFYFEGFCSINTTDFSLFENKIAFLLNINYKKYAEQTKEQRKYMMEYNPDMPAHVYMRKIIEKELKR